MRYIYDPIISLIQVNLFRPKCFIPKSNFSLHSCSLSRSVPACHYSSHRAAPRPWGSCVTPGRRGALPASAAGALTPACSPAVARAELHSLVWRGGVSWRRHLFCDLRQDTTLLCEWFSFRQCYTDCEKQKQSGPFAICTYAQLQ